VYRLRAVKEVGGYTPGHLIEDYDLTLRMKEAGWNARFNPSMQAWTEVPKKFCAFAKQRLRWLRGGVEVLLDHGVNRFTVEDTFQHLFFLVFLFGVMGFVISSSLTGGWHLRFYPRPLPIAVAVFGYAVSLYKLRYLENPDLVDILIRAVILPELLMSLIMTGLQLYAYGLVVLGRPKNW